MDENITKAKIISKISARPIIIPINPWILPFVDNDIAPKITAGKHKRINIEGRLSPIIVSPESTAQARDKFPIRELSLLSKSSIDFDLSNLFSLIGNDAKAIFTNTASKVDKNIFFIIILIFNVFN